jgi:hypothetical protein
MEAGHLSLAIDILRDNPDQLIRRTVGEPHLNLHGNRDLGANLACEMGDYLICNPACIASHAA